MTAYIVHWQDVVGQEFIGTFCKMAKAEYYANLKHPTNSEAMTKEAYKYFSDEEKDAYNKKRHYMRRCGYIRDGEFIRWLGWLGVPALQGETLRYKTTAGDDRRYIPLSEFLDFKKGQEQVADEDEYYARFEVESAIKKVTEPKKYTMNPEFVKEDDYEESA